MTDDVPSDRPDDFRQNSDRIAVNGELMPVVRISKGKCADVDVAERLLQDSEAALRVPLTQLRGLLHYYVGIDRASGYLTNISVWEDLAAAHQMDTLQAMLNQRPLLEAVGVTFEVITNHQTLWTITP